MTIFRDEFGANFVLLFSTLLFLKVFHWLSADRVEFMEQTPSVSRLFHIRMVSVLWTLFCLDFFLVAFAVEVLILDKNRMGIMIMFASEYMILSATLWSTIAKYIINVQDSRSEEPWEGKSMYVFFVDLATDFLKLMTYVTFFALILSFYGLPLNIIRDVFLTARSFFGRVRDFIKYRAATKNMDTRFPDATRQDLSTMSDGTCIICREDMMARSQDEADDAGEATSMPGAGSRGEPGGGLNETPKKLPCGHIFHFHCLRSWLERQQSCPTCRRTVFAVPQTQAGGAAVPGQAAGTTRPDATDRGGALGTHAAVAGGGDGNNASQTARDRLQGFLQQLQSDAQRVRQHASPQTAARATPAPTRSAPSPQQAQPASSPAPRNSTTADSSSSANTASAEVTPSGRARVPVQRALISSLFGQSEAVGKRGVGDTESIGQNSTAMPKTKQKNDLVSTLVPPAPWTFRPSKTAPVQDSSLSRGSASVQRSAGTSRKDTPAKEEEEEEEETKPLDPADAREAARAAALKRFGLSNGTSSPSSAPLTKARVEKGKQRAEPVKESDTPNMPGDPVLIPLFDTSSVMDYETDFASHLPFPLAPRSSATPLSTNLDVDLDSTDSLLQFSAEQLRNLSLRSRRGLEERLRLLNRVEGAIGNLVEELTRALSVLPSGDDVDERSESSVKEKGKAAVPAFDL